MNKWFARIKEKVESENLEIKGNYQLFNLVWVKHTDSYILYKKYFKNLKQIKEATK